MRRRQGSSLMGDTGVNYRLLVTDVTEENRKAKYTSAIEGLAKAMELPITIKPRMEEGGEGFPYRAQEELVSQWTLYLGRVLDTVYRGLCRHLELPLVTTFSKAIDDELVPLTIRGKMMFNPETGRPITRGEWRTVIDAIEKYLNRHLKGTEKQIVLDSSALGRILSRMLKHNTYEAVRDLPLHELKYRRYTYDYVTSSAKRLRETAKLSEIELHELQLAEDVLGTHVVEISQKTVRGIKDTFIRGVRQKRPKGRIAQDLFDTFGGINKDWQRIVEYETNDTMNNAFLREELNTRGSPGEAVYMRRLEIIDRVTCPFCRRINGMIVRVVDEPLESEEIKDPFAKVAIWPGKSNIGRRQSDWWVAAGSQHPYCRGSWEREFPGEEGSLEAEAERMAQRQRQGEREWGKSHGGQG